VQMHKIGGGAYFMLRLANYNGRKGLSVTGNERQRGGPGLVTVLASEI